MNVLCFDLTITPGSVALLHDGEITHRALTDQRTQGTRTLTEVDLLLNAQNLSVDALDEFWVITGPGSFTGIRIALATALGLSKPHESKVVGVTSFALMACAAKLAGAKFPLCVGQQSHQGDYFYQVWKDAASAAVALQGARESMGTSVLVRDLGKTETFATISVSAREVLALREELLAGNFVTSPEPFYIRPPDVTTAKERSNT